MRDPRQAGQGRARQAKHPRIVIFAILSGGTWSTRQEMISAGFLLFFIAGGFLLDRYFHQQSPVFHLLYRFGKLQTSGGSLRDRCLMNFSILAMLGILLIFVAIFDI